MADQYDSVSVVSYNANPPADDGTQTEANRVKWSTIKTKLTDMLNTAIASMNTNILAAFAKVDAGVTSTAISYQVLEADQGKLVRATASGVTITTPDAAGVGAPFLFDISNSSTGDITLDGSGSQTVDGSASIVIPAGCGARVRTDGTNWFTSGQNFLRALPPAGSFKNLSIKVASNTTVTVAADSVTMTDGATSITAAISGTTNLGSNAAVDRLDTGTIAAATFYAIWAIAKADGTTGTLASLSATSPTLPTGYTFKARIGWVRTADAVAQLMGTWQFGKRAQYVVGLAQTSALPTPGSTSSATWAAKSVSGIVPSTAATIFLVLYNASPSTSGAAPNSSYAVASPTTAPPPIMISNGTGSAAAAGGFLLESTSIYLVANAGTVYSFASGWEDNI